MEQPNATGDDDAALTPRFWLMVVLTGVATGLFGVLLMWILFGVQHLAFRHHTGELHAAVERVSDAPRLIVLVVTSAASEIVIGMGASIGREAAPKLMGGVSGSVLANWARLSPAQSRLLYSARLAAK